jgi:hypothetical protein
MTNYDLISPSATVSANTAALLLGRRAHAIAGLIQTGCLDDASSRDSRWHWRAITIGSISRYRDRPVYADELAAAKAKLNQRYVDRETRRAAAA